MQKHEPKKSKLMLLIILMSYIIYLLAWYLDEFNLFLIGILLQVLLSFQQLKYGKYQLELDKAKQEEHSALVRIRDALSRRDAVTHESLRVSLYLSHQVQKIQHKLKSSRP